MQAIKRTTRCDRCGGVFTELTDERAYFGNHRNCRTCGAGPHWEDVAAPDHSTWPPWTGGSNYEAGTFWIGLGNVDRRRDPDADLPRPEPPLAPCLTASSEGFRDVDGSWIPAWSMLGETVAVRRHPYRGHRLFAIDFDPDGWHIRKAGATGQEDGRPPKGIQDRERLIDEVIESQTITRITPQEYREMKANGSLYADAPRTKREIQRYIAQAIRDLPDHSNIAAVAALYELTPRRVQQIRKISPKSP
jgi:hypothetical protein